MRLTVLGKSPAWQDAGGACSGYLVEDGETRVLLDCGSGVFAKLREHGDYCGLDAVIVSHMHVDHVLDLLALRHALAYNPLPAPAPVPVWLPPGGAEHLAQATAPFDACDKPGRFTSTVTVAEYDPARPLTIGDVVVTFSPTVHYIPAWAIRVQTTVGPSLGYTGDTGPSAALAGFLTGVHILVAEATLLEPGARPPGERGSLTAAEAGQLAVAAGAEILILTHMWEERGFEAYRAQAEAIFLGRIELAAPGLTVC